MLNKKITALVLVITFVLSFSIIFSANAAADDPTWFKPNVAIPGMENWLGALKPITSGPMAEGGFRGYEIDGESIGKYISGIYDFTAGFVGIIAMFMLVIAGWQWLFAAGSADKINNAKGTINGVLIGLALLFGGHIILEQISVRLTEFEGITMDEIAGRTSSCHGLSEASCNKFSVDCRWNKKSDHTWGCVNVSIKDLCHERTKKSECDESQSCEWSGFNCVPSTVPRCGLSKEEVSGGGMMNVYCCQKDGEVKYSYDPMPVQYCSALCGEGWGGAPKNLCYLRLEY